MEIAPPSPDDTDVDALLAISGDYLSDDGNTQVYVRPHTPPAATVAPETLRPVMLAPPTPPVALSADQIARRAATTKLARQDDAADMRLPRRSAGAKVWFAASFAITAAAIVFALSSRGVPQRAASQPAATQAAVKPAPLSLPPPVALPAAAPIPETSVDALPRVAKAKRASKASAIAPAPTQVAAAPAPKPAAPKPAAPQAPDRPKTDFEAAQDAANLAKAQIEASLR